MTVIFYRDLDVTDCNYTILMDLINALSLLMYSNTYSSVYYNIINLEYHYDQN